MSNKDNPTFKEWTDQYVADNIDKLKAPLVQDRKTGLYYNPQEAFDAMMNKQEYLVALPTFPGGKGFNHPTILVSAKNLSDAISLVRHLRPHDNIGDIKVVNYS